LIDTNSIELIHPRPGVRSEKQIGKKGMSNKHWIVGGELCFVLNHIGLIVDQDVSTANVYDGLEFQGTAEPNVMHMVSFSGKAIVKKDWHLGNLKICTCIEWNTRMFGEMVL
jgi:hypothetical protein